MQAAAKAVWARAEGKLCLVHGHIHFSVRETQSDAMQSRERSACAVVQHIGERLFSVANRKIIMPVPSCYDSGWESHRAWRMEWMPGGPGCQRAGN